MESIRANLLREYVQIGLIFFGLSSFIFSGLYILEVYEEKKRNLIFLKHLGDGLEKRMDEGFSLLELIKSRLSEKEPSIKNTDDVSALLNDDFINENFKHASRYLISLKDPCGIWSSNGRLTNLLLFKDFIQYLESVEVEKGIFLSRDDLYLFRKISNKEYVCLKCSISTLLNNKIEGFFIQEQDLPIETASQFGYLDSPITIKKAMCDRYIRLKGTSVVLILRKGTKYNFVTFCRDYSQIFFLALVLGMSFMFYILFRQKNLKKKLRNQFQESINNYKSILELSQKEIKECRRENEKLKTAHINCQERFKIIAQLNFRLHQMECENLEISRMLLRDLASMSKSSLDKTEQIKLINMMFENSNNILNGVLKSDEREEVLINALIEQAVNLSNQFSVGDKYLIKICNDDPEITTYVDPLIGVCLLTNVIHKSLDRMPKGSVLKVCVSKSVQQDRDFAVISIEDNGYILQDVDFLIDAPTQKRIDVLNLPWSSLMLMAENLSIQMSLNSSEDNKNITSLCIPIHANSDNVVSRTNVINIFSKANSL